MSGSPPPDTAVEVGVGYPPRDHQEENHRDQQVLKEHAKDEGPQVMAALMEADVAAVCGPRGRHDPKRTTLRHG